MKPNTSKEEKLKLIDISEDKKDFEITLPKRFNEDEQTIVRFENRLGEWMYIPRKYTFGRNYRLCIEEVQAILSKLKELNK